MKEIVERRKELFLRRIPRLHQVVVNFGFVDGIDSGVGVGVGGQQGTLGLGMNIHGLGEETYAIHVRHALIGKKQGDRIVSSFEFAQGAEAGAAGVGAHDAVFLRVVAAQVAFDGAEHFGIIING